MPPHVLTCQRSAHTLTRTWCAHTFTQALARADAHTVHSHAHTHVHTCTLQILRYTRMCLRTLVCMCTCANNAYTAHTCSHTLRHAHTRAVGTWAAWHVLSPEPGHVWGHPWLAGCAPGVPVGRGHGGVLTAEPPLSSLQLPWPRPRLLLRP